MVKNEKRGGPLIVGGLFVGIGIGLIIGETAAGTLIGLGIGFIASFFVDKR